MKDRKKKVKDRESSKEGRRGSWGTPWPTGGLSPFVVKG